MSWLAQQFTNMITTFLDNVINDLLKFIMSILNELLVNPIQMNALPGFDAIIAWIQYLCSLALAFVLVKELFLNQLEELGDSAVSPLVILKNTLIAAVLIWLSPMLITDVLIPITLELIDIVNATIGSTPNLTVDLSSGLAIGTSGVSAVLLRIAPEIGPWSGLLVTAIILLAVLIIGVQAGLRWAELYFLALVGPILALSKASFSNSWNLWLRETVATTLSQIVQYFGCVMALTVLAHPDFMDRANGLPIEAALKILMIIGFLIFAIAGPRTLRGIISAGNQTGLRAVGSIIQTAAKGVKLGV
ncbi:conjugal transfer protein TrbL family protein [Alicyclobacillus macrosporangiidus]|uniref:TrbL/VirB6 plasmid conjugal transfer protein n=1 Tax=Alicyclobacillus macrosporangiidus TaxID=392015 RepID=A0A1I7L2X6_9BACL|nr:conjugal transfer protein TrbL family protein [Alicyclobacillus macrosporangiidus]SFV03874.1 hypothetical protein SAMN05421543_12353 [Alicyclobacillus macrosporangiidus]